MCDLTSYMFCNALCSNLSDTNLGVRPRSGTNDISNISNDIVCNTVGTDTSNTNLGRRSLSNEYNSASKHSCIIVCDSSIDTDIYKHVSAGHSTTLLQTNGSSRECLTSPLNYFKKSYHTNQISHTVLSNPINPVCPQSGSQSADCRVTSTNNDISVQSVSCKNVSAHYSCKSHPSISQNIDLNIPDVHKSTPIQHSPDTGHLNATSS